MEYTALYRKYRPKSFEDVCGQDVIVKILKNSITNNKIGHAYLFAGTRGTGKTSIAKIFAKAVNCTDTSSADACNECEVCKSLESNDIDIIELDAASNNGVDEIREIINNTKLVPSISKYKVYIIDEVHMLSTGAFNALLKTLEEPPEHVIFILATTEVHKIPLTILSRCQRYDFKKMSSEVLYNRLKYITKKEKKNVQDDILKLISELGDGSFRDSINLLDQIIDMDDLTEEFLYKLSGNVNQKEITSFLKLVVNNDIKGLLDKIKEFGDNGTNYISIAEKMMVILRDISINNSVHDYFDSKYEEELNEFSIDTDKIQEVLKLLIDLIADLRKSLNQKVTFEIYMITMANRLSSNIPVKESVPKEANEIIEEAEEDVPEETNEDYEELKRIRVNNVLATADKKILDEVNVKLKDIEEYISNKKYNNVARLLLKSKLVCAGIDYLLFMVESKTIINTFYENIFEIEELIELLLEKKYKVSFLSPEEWEETKKEFISNKKNNKKYEIISEKSDIIYKRKSDTENEAIALFGEESITVK